VRWSGFLSYLSLFLLLLFSPSTCRATRGIHRSSANLSIHLTTLYGVWIPGFPTDLVHPHHDRVSFTFDLVTDILFLLAVRHPKRLSRLATFSLPGWFDFAHVASVRGATCNRASASSFEPQTYPSNPSQVLATSPAQHYPIHHSHCSLNAPHPTINHYLSMGHP
jgi:hypothetical protein